MVNLRDTCRIVEPSEAGSENNVYRDDDLNVSFLVPKSHVVCEDFEFTCPQETPISVCYEAKEKYHADQKAALRILPSDFFSTTSDGLLKDFSAKIEILRPPK